MRARRSRRLRRCRADTGRGRAALPRARGALGRAGRLGQRRRRGRPGAGRSPGGAIAHRLAVGRGAHAPFTWRDRCRTPAARRSRAPARRAPDADRIRRGSSRYAQAGARRAQVRGGGAGALGDAGKRDLGGGHRSSGGSRSFRRNGGARGGARGGRGDGASRRGRLAAHRHRGARACLRPRRGCGRGGQAQRRGRRGLRRDHRFRRWAARSRGGRPAASLPRVSRRARMIFALLLAAQVTRLPQLLEAPPAVYPPDRLVRGETADVACSVDIDEHGAVTQVVVEQPVAPDFDSAAVEAIRRFRFSPAEVDGQPAPVRIRYVYHFVLERQRVAAPTAATGTVTGLVLEAGNRRPIAGAEVVDETGAQAVTDAAGRYALVTAPGARKLTLSAPGFETRQLDATVAEGRTIEARRISLHRAAVGDLQATVPGEQPHDAPTRRVLTHDELVNVPGSLNDPIRAVQNLPGLARAPFLGGALLVRGSPPQDTGTYLDGHRIPQLYHFLGGPSVINEQLLDRIDFYPGGYGAVYGRNLTGAIDVGTRKGDPNGLHGQASLDMLEGVAFLEGPLGPRTQGAIAARRSHIDLFLPLFIPNDPDRGVTSIVPIYWDYQARLDHRLENGDDLGLLFFGSDDRLSIVQRGGRRALPLSVNSHLAFHRIVATWKHAVSDTVSLTVSPALGWTKQSAESEGVGPAGFANPQSADITVLTGELRSEARWQARDFLELRAGTDIELDRASYTADIASSLQLRNLGIPI